MAGNENSGRRAKPIIDPITGLELPAGTPEPYRNAAVGDSSLDRLDELTRGVSECLRAEEDAVCRQLACVAVNFELNAGIRECVSLGKPGPKPHMDVQWLLIDCAQIYVERVGGDIAQVLASIDHIDIDSSHKMNWAHPVIRWAGAVLIAVGSDQEIGRRQIAGAIERYKANVS